MSIKKYNTFFIGKSLKATKNKTKKRKKKNSLKFADYRKELSYLLVLFLIITGIKLISYLTDNQTVAPELEKHSVSDKAADSDKGKVRTDNYFDELGSLAESLEQLDLERLKLGYQGESNTNDREKIKKVNGVLNSGETLYACLIKEGISPAEIQRLGERVQTVVDIGRLNAGVRFTVYYNNDGKIVQFDYKPNKLDAYYIKIPESELANIEVEKEEIFREVVCIEGGIENTLYQAMLNYCNSGELAVRFADIFAWDLDLITECQKGDTFKVLVERLYRGDFYRWGEVLAAVYEGETHSTHTAVLFEDPDGHADYYDVDGRCLRKAFLRAPLNYKYISSEYTQNRFHPILRIWRPHLAIDYAAPTGTPVVAIGNGTVITRCYDNGYGNYIEVRHPNGYVSGYGHLSKFAQGLKIGKKVEQGEIIGYVGATGLATGPHLDFSMSKDGNKIDFLKLESPPSASVSTEYQPYFEQVMETYLSILK